MSAERPTRWSLLLGGLAAGLVGVLVLGFLAKYERRDVRTAVPFSGEARRNPYLAAHRLLERMGMQVQSLDGMIEFDELERDLATSGTLIVPTERMTFSRERSADLLDWTRAGGHLVLIAWTDWDDEERREDFILDAIGVRQRIHDYEADEDEDADPPAHPLVTDEIALVSFPDRENPLQAEFEGDYRLEREPDEHLRTIGDANGVHIMQVREGQGLVSVMSDEAILGSGSIGVLDHAELLWRILHTDGRAGPVWLVFNEDYPGALALAWRYAWMVGVSGAVLLIAWIWLASRRFGPVQPDDPLERRRLMEHVEAVGRFQWRQGTAKGLTEGVRESLLARMRERHPAWAGLNPARLNDRLAEISGLPLDAVARALAFGAETDHDRFARNISTLEKIRKAL